MSTNSLIDQGLNLFTTLHSAPGCIDAIENIFSRAIPFHVFQKLQLITTQSSRSKTLTLVLAAARCRNFSIGLTQQRVECTYIHRYNTWSVLGDGVVPPAS